MYIAMFFADITLFYLIPLVISVVLYTLISIMLLYTAPRTFNDGSVRNQARLQVICMGHKGGHYGNLESIYIYDIDIFYF